MRFTEPLVLLLLVPLLLGLGVSYRHVHGMAKGRKRFAFTVRTLLILLLVVALAGPESRQPNIGTCTLFVIDRSDSVSDADRLRAEQFVKGALANLGTQDSAGVVVFGKNALVEASASGARTLGLITSKVNGSASDIAGAVRLATASFPEGKARRIVLLSDGNETSGDLSEAAQVAATDGIPLDVVPLGQNSRKGEAAVVALEAPSDSRVDQPIDLRVVIDSNVEQQGTLDVDRDGIIVKRVPVSLVSGKNVVLVADTLKNVGFHRYRATLRSPRDQDNRNNIGLGFVTVRGKPRLLVLQSKLDETALVSALRKNGIDVDLGSPANVPSKAEELQRYDAILLNDIAASNFTDSQMKLIKSAVRDSGIGFAMIGGEDSFLPGGWYGTPVADILPVDLNIRQRKTFPSTSILVIADASGSMGMVEDGFEKIRLAAMAAERTVEMMSPMDRVGVAGSSDGIEFVAPMQKLTDKAFVISQVRKLGIGGGGIYIGPTVEKAEEVLNKETSKVRHFILLADGSDSTDERDAIVRTMRMRANHITTSVVAIGDGSDVPLLKRVAQAGGGRFYLADRAGKLPAIFTQDTSLMSRSAIEEGAFLPKLSFGEEILRGVADTGVPPLLAYCLTDRRPLSRIGMRTQKDDPLLATWQFGLGTSLAFTSDAHPRWAKNWVGWPGFSTFWSQAARAVSRRVAKNRYQVNVSNEHGKGLVEVQATDPLGNPAQVMDSVARVSTPDGNFREVPLSQQAPGKFTGSFDVNSLGTYIVTVPEKDPQGGVRTAVTGFSVPYPAEYRTYRPNTPLLERVATTTGGKTLVRPEDAVRAVKEPGESIQELWSSFLFAAALLLPFDIGIRRLALPLAELFAKLMARLRKSSNPAETSAPVVVDRLRQAKQRANTGDGSSGETADKVRQTVSVEASPRPRSPQVPSGGNTAKDLLEKKRERRG